MCDFIKTPNPSCLAAERTEKRDSEEQLSSQFHWNSKDFGPCFPFITLKNLFVSIKMSWRKKRLLDAIWLAWNKILYKHTGRRQSLPCKVFNIDENSRAGYTTRKQSAGWAIMKNRVTVNQLPLISSVGPPAKSSANCQTMKPPRFTWEKQITACQKQTSL